MFAYVELSVSVAILVWVFLTTYDKVYMPRPGQAGPGWFLGMTMTIG